jgi:hypothetical protein
MQDDSGTMAYSRRIASANPENLSGALARGLCQPGYFTPMTCAALPKSQFLPWQTGVKYPD